MTTCISKTRLSNGNYRYKFSNGAVRYGPGDFCRLGEIVDEVSINELG